MPSPPRRDTRERELLSAYGQLGDANEVLNERAVAVMKRMSDKLTGRDFLQVEQPCFLLSFMSVVKQFIWQTETWHAHPHQASPVEG